ncbi:hypothetical protein [Acidiphilium sp.]|uniref:hypothetical protein n=1 Tax=Acidiphilium sp. TaxID=527 RepID=UPI003CFE2B20
MSGLVVLEGRWQNNRNVSVKSLFDLLVDMEFNNIHNYHYENFTNVQSFRAILNNIFLPNAHKRYLYIGGHGDEINVNGTVDNVSRTEIRNSLHEIQGGQLRGFFVGACLFGNEENAGFFFAPEIGVVPTIRWFAGYQGNVDWIKSSVMDIIFWQRIFSERIRHPGATENTIIENVCNYLNHSVSGLMEELEFQVYRRRPQHPNEPERLIGSQ